MSGLRLRIGDAWRNFWIRLGNRRRLLSRRRIEYILIELFGSLPEYTTPPAFWRRLIPIPGFYPETDSLSLSAVRSALDRIAADPRPLGIVIRLDGLATGWGTAQNVRQIITRFRESGKRVVAYADDFSTMNYFIACAADEILAPPIAGWNVLGLRLEAIFLKEALESWGIEGEVIAVSPYKTAGDFISRSDMSPEQRENLNQILDDQFDEIVTAIATGRGKTKDQVREWIDQAPLSAENADQQGFFDSISYFDQIPAYLGEKNKLQREARMETWPNVWRRVLKPILKRSGKVIGVVSLEGVIVPGPSRRVPLPLPIPFIGNTQAGADTVSRTLRQVERDPRIAAVIFHVDSRGGSSLASDLIWREVARIRRKKPVVVFMGNYAASGGYYVSADADWIIAQPLTITGSIGVILVKLATQELFNRLKIHRVKLERGERASLFVEQAIWKLEERAVVEEYITDIYERFKQKVAAGRKIDPNKVDEISGGRVWLGRQALANNLIDEFGDFHAAEKKAQELAGLDPAKFTPSVWITPRDGLILPGPIPPQPFNTSRFFTTLMNQRAWLIDPLFFEIQ
jgi:protease-4